MRRKRAPKALPETGWFALVDAGLAALAGALWYLWPDLGWLPLIPALLPWAVRLAYRRPLFQRTSLDVFFLLLITTALIGVWAAYDRPRALAKFWLVLDGVLFFYALAGQPRGNRWTVAWALGGASAALAAYYYLTHDWTLEPAKIEALNNIGLAWMRMRPALPLPSLHPNVVAGLLIVLLPFLAACALRAWRRGRRRAAYAAISGLLFAFSALVMTTSRGAWIGLSLAAGLWLLWLLSGGLAKRLGRRRRPVFLAAFTGLAITGIAFVLTFPGGPLGLVNRLPGPSSTGSRLDLYQALVLLIGDFPVTGSGLDTFPGLYSHYILISPSYFLEHGHNLYLDMALEQGPVGALAGLAILILGGRELAAGILRRESSSSSTSLILWAALTSMLAMSLHALMDDTLYGSRAQMLLWIGPAFIIAARPHRDSRSSQAPSKTDSSSRSALTAGALILALIVYAWLFRNPLMAAWESDLAGLEMARVELAAFPSDRWDDGSDAVDLRPSAARFENVLELDPNNRTAHFKLGLVTALFREFDMAVGHLQTAYELSPGHPGIRKSLAYNLVWAGRINEALPLLQQIPEAQAEMGIYVNWWQGNGRDDLSDRAAEVTESLAIP